MRRKLASILVAVGVVALFAGVSQAVSNQARLFEGYTVSGATVTYETITVSSHTVVTVAAVSKGMKRTYINPSAAIVRYKKGTTVDVVDGNYMAATSVREDDAYYGEVSFLLPAGVTAITTFVVETIRIRP